LTVKQPRAEEWASEWTRLIGENVRALRKARSLSTQKLSDKCAEQGFPVPRNTIVNLETGRKETLSVQELTVIALALDASPVSLLYPLDRPAEIAPGQYRNPFHAGQWFAGEWDSVVPGPIAASDRLVDPHWQILRDYVSHADVARRSAAIIESLRGNEKASNTRRNAELDLQWALDEMAKEREVLNDAGIVPPDIAGLDDIERRFSR
jgi:transcriptional regulator with XRE-family HTH domain